MSDIFISYSRKDKDFVMKLIQVLKEHKLSVWIDLEDIRSGEQWKNRIFQGIADATVFLFLISPDSVVSEICNEEFAKAVDYHKRIRPIYIRETSNEKIPKPIADLNWIYCRYIKQEGEAGASPSFVMSDDLDIAIGKIIEAVRTDSDWLVFHKNLLVKALEWQQKKYKKGFLLHGENLEDIEKVYYSSKHKEPLPTELQKHYIEVSRVEEDKRNSLLRILRIGLGAIAICAAIAIIVAVALGGQVRSESTAREKAQLNELARQLSSKAQDNLRTPNSNDAVTILLAIEAIKLAPSAEAAQILQDNKLARTISHMTFEDQISSVVFSSDGKYVAGTDGTIRAWETLTGKKVARVDGLNPYKTKFSFDGKYTMSVFTTNMISIWETFTGKKVAQLTYPGHIGDAAFSPNGKYVAAAGDDSLIVWEISSRKEIARKSSNGEAFRSVAFTPNGKYILSLQGSRGALIWEFSTGREIRRISTYFADIYAFSPDGKYLVTNGGVDNSYENILHIQDATDGQEIVVLPENCQSNVLLPGGECNRGIQSFSISPDSKLLVTGGVDNIAHVWQLTAGAASEIAQMTHDASVQGVAFSRDSKYVVSGGGTTASVWEATTGKETARIVHTGGVNSVAFSPDGKYAVSGGADGAWVWETIAKPPMMNITLRDRVNSVALSPDGKYVVSGSDDNVARVWEVASGKEISHISHEDRVSAVAFSPDGRYIASGSFDGVNVWEATTAKEISRLAGGGYVFMVAFSPDGKYVAVGGPGVTVWEAATGKRISSMAGKVTSLAFSPDSRYLATGNQLTDYATEYGTVSTAHIWEITTGKEIATHIGDDITSVAFSPDSNYVVAGSIGEYVALLEVAPKEESNQSGNCTKKSIPQYKDAVNSVAISPDNKIVSGSADGTVLVWDICSGNTIIRLQQNSEINFVTFSPDGKYVAAQSQNIVHIWQITTGLEIARMVHNGKITSFSFSPDGKYVTAGSEDKTISVGLWQPQNLIDNACSRMTRNLTSAEWDQYIGDKLGYQAICTNLPVE